MTDRRSVLRKIGLGAAAVVTVGAGAHALVSPSREAEEPSPSSTAATPSPTPQSTPSPTADREVTPRGFLDRIGTGVYLGDESALAGWENWFGRTVDYYSMTVPRERWEDYRVANMPLEVPLGDIVDERRLTVTFSMFPPEQTDMEAVAAGEHSDRYRRLGRDFVELGATHAFFRFGGEMNGDWGPDTAVGRPDLYVRAWREIAETLGSVDGAEFECVWAPNIGRRDMPPLRAYPGDEYVDQIGLTVYDAGGQYYPFPQNCDSDCVLERRRSNWQRLVTQEYGLEDWATFARERDKPLVFPEYGITAQSSGLVGGGDNPHFFRWFDEWMRENDDVVEWHSPWAWIGGPHYIGPERLFATDEYPPHPEASRTFKRLYGRPDGS